MERLFNEYGAHNEHGRRKADAFRALTLGWITRQENVDLNDLELVLMQELACSMAELRITRANEKRRALRTGWRARPYNQ
jgi:hypothetical protein